MMFKIFTCSNYLLLSRYSLMSWEYCSSHYVHLHQLHEIVQQLRAMAIWLAVFPTGTDGQMAPPIPIHPFLLLLLPRKWKRMHRHAWQGQHLISIPTSPPPWGHAVRIDALARNSRGGRARRGIEAVPAIDRIPHHRRHSPCTPSHP